MDNNYAKFGSSTFQQVIGIPMYTYCAPLVYCYETDFMLWSFSIEHQSDIITAFNNTSMYTEDLFNKR